MFCCVKGILPKRQILPIIFTLAFIRQVTLHCTVVAFGCQ